jgi:fructoselysine-6-P-deglycase FrlB-like protein
MIYGVTMDINAFEQKAISSLLFTSPVLSDDTAKFLSTKSKILSELAEQALSEKVEHIYWVGAGNSRVNLMSGKELMDRFTTIPSDCFHSYEFIWRNPERLGKKSWVFLASFSGATEDTVAALRFAKSKGAKTIVFVNQADSLMGREADVTIDYNSKALYILPLVGSYLFSLELARLQGNKSTDSITHGLNTISDLFAKQYKDERDRQLSIAEAYKDQDMFYTLGCNSLYGLAYKFGLTVFMENMRVNGSFIELTEFRHGPVEMLEKHRPAFILLKSPDDSGPMVERVTSLLKQAEVPLLVYDSAAYGNYHALLAPFTLMIPLQWFAVWSAYYRGIYDLDDRVFMGHGIMGQGRGVTWP